MKRNKDSYSWIMNKYQSGKQTEEGQWHSVPHPHLAVQHPFYVHGSNAASKYWHPDWVVFKSDEGKKSAWYADSRTSQNIDGPFKTRSEAIAFVEDDVMKMIANIKPSHKSEAVEDALKAITGKDRKQSINSKICNWCDAPVGEFKDALSAKEYTISGMCQGCQDSVVG